LTLATTHLGVWLVRQVSDAEEIEHLLCNLLVLRRRRSKKIDVCCPAHQNDIANREREKPELGLRHVTKDAGQPPA
jgi:hypothetical protein